MRPYTMHGLAAQGAGSTQALCRKQPELQLAGGIGKSWKPMQEGMTPHSVAQPEAVTTPSVREPELSVPLPKLMSDSQW
jgi:hypothetical protein